MERAHHPGGSQRRTRSSNAATTHVPNLEWNVQKILIGEKKKFPNIPLQRAGERGNKQRGGLKKIGTKSRRPRIEKEKWRESISSFKLSLFFLKQRCTFPSCICIQRLRRVVCVCFVPAFGPCSNLTWTGTCGLMRLPRQDAERSRRRSPHRVTQGLVNTRPIHINAGGTTRHTHPMTPSGLNLCKKRNTPLKIIPIFFCFLIHNN